MQYLAFVERDGAGAYRATLPDFPGCVAAAASWLQLEGAIRHAVLEHVEQRDAPFPSPTPIELLNEESGPPNSCWMLVSLFAYETQRPPRPARRQPERRLGL
jgi:predicted RNase H-like HicB family nuclease